MGRDRHKWRQAHTPYHDASACICAHKPLSYKKICDRKSESESESSLTDRSVHYTILGNPADSLGAGEGGRWIFCMARGHPHW